MSDKEMCAVNIKPKTDVWTFRLKDPKGFELEGSLLESRLGSLLDRSSGNSFRTPSRNHFRKYSQESLRESSSKTF